MSRPYARPSSELRDGSEAPRKRRHPSEQDRGPLRAGEDRQTLTAAQLLTAQQLADRWQVPKGHVYRLTREGRIPVVRLGRYFRYRIDAIERWEEGDTHA